MGATTFMTVVEGPNPRKAFETARKDAQWQDGNNGYTGTIAEKHAFIVVPLPEGVVATDHAQMMIDRQDPRIDDTDGPAGCIELGEGKFLFFGWARE